MADWSCPQCGWVNRGFADSCLSCGTKRPGEAELAGSSSAPGAGRWDLQGTAATAPPPMPASISTLDPTPMAAGGYPPAAAETAAQGNPFGILGLPGGIIGALVAAVIGSVVWYAVVAFSSLQIGFVAAAVGWLVGKGAVLGARGRGSVWLAGVSVLVTVLALGVSEYLIAYHWVTRELGFELNLLQPPDVIVDIVISVLQDDPLTLAFWAFAVVVAAVIPFKAITPQPPIQAPVPDNVPDA